MRIAPGNYFECRATNNIEQTHAQPVSPPRVVEGARIVLLVGEGRQDEEAASLRKITPKKVSRWRRRFLIFGIA